MLESSAAVRYEYHGEDSEADGTLYLLSSGRIEFWTRSLFLEEVHHWYDRSDILDVTVITGGSLEADVPAEQPEIYDVRSCDTRDQSSSYRGNEKRL